MNEIKMISTSFKQIGDTRSSPFEIGDHKYRCVRADNFSICARDGKAGVIVARTSGSFIVAYYAAGMYPAVCAEAVEKLAEYFREKGE